MLYLSYFLNFVLGVCLTALKEKKIDYWLKEDPSKKHSKGMSVIERSMATKLKR